MLKIKDNVDLKELEKFGFDKWFDYEGNIYKAAKFIRGFFFTYYDEENNLKEDLITISKKTRIIEITDSIFVDIIQKKLEELDEAEIIESVGGHRLSK